MRLAPGEMAIFGYGSLLSQRSMELTLGKAYAKARIPCGLEGWRRSWDVMMPNRNFYEPTPEGEFVPHNIIYLNVRESPGETVNGVLYVVDQAELEGFDRREWIYDRMDVTSALRGVHLEGPACVYVGKQAWIVPAQPSRTFAAVRQSYLDIIEQGLVDLGQEARALYERSTDPVPGHLVFADRKRGDTHSTLADARQS
jgi:cation transport regulator ChaC